MFVLAEFYGYTVAPTIVLQVKFPLEDFRKNDVIPGQPNFMVNR